MTITEFLLARIAEDEVGAKAATGGPWYWDEDGYLRSRAVQGRWPLSGTTFDVCVLFGGGYDDGRIEGESADRTHVTRWDPARVLRECKAKREALEAAWHDHLDLEGEFGSGRSREELDRVGNVPDVAAGFAAVYAYHPDYDPHWA